MRIFLILTLIPLVLVLILVGALVTNPEIEYQIAQALIRGEGVPKNHDWGVFWMRRAADGGQADAQAELGRSYLVGLPEQNLAEAARYLMMGEKKNNNECIKLLSYAYSYGQGVPQDYERAIALSKRSNDIERDGREMMNVSFLTLILPAPHRNYRESKKYSEDLARLGYSSAWSYWSLGLIYEYGLGTHRDPAKAAQLYEQGSKLGDNDCQYSFVRMGMEGKLARKDSVLLRKYLDNASVTQVLDAQLLLALVLATENRDSARDRLYADLLEQLGKRGFKDYSARLKFVSGPGQKSDSKAAIRSAKDESADTDGSALLVAAMSKRFGIGGTPDFKGFMETLDRAVAKESADAIAIKANILTGMDAGSPDYGAAAKLYQRAAGKGHVNAQGQLGMLHALGLGVRHDWAQAISLLESSAGAGEPESQFMLAGFYCDGRGVKPNRVKAIELFEQAAVHGHEDAALEAGIICGSNHFPDSKQDVDRAEKWFRAAAGYGLQEANYYLGNMLNNRGRYKPALECYKEAAAQGHLLCQLQLGRYYRNRGEFDLSRKWFEAALKQGSTTAPREMKLLVIRESALNTNRDASSLVVAKKRIERGAIITTEMVARAPNDLKDESEERWHDDIITDLHPILGTVAEQTIDEGSYITTTDVDVPELSEPLSSP